MDGIEVAEERDAVEEDEGVKEEGEGTGEEEEEVVGEVVGDIAQARRFPKAVAVEVPGAVAVEVEEGEVCLDVTLIWERLKRSGASWRNRAHHSRMHSSASFSPVGSPDAS